MNINTDIFGYAHVHIYGDIYNIHKYNKFSLHIISISPVILNYHTLPWSIFLILVSAQLGIWRIKSKYMLFLKRNMIPLSEYIALQLKWNRNNGILNAN